MKSKLQYLLSVYALISAVTLISILVFFLSRGILAIVSGSDAFVGAESIGRSMLTALRFDVAVVLRAYFLGLLLAIFVMVLPGRIGRMHRFVWYFNVVLGVMILLLALGLSFSNISYVQFFGRPFDSFVFHGLAYGSNQILESIVVLRDFFPALIAILVLGVAVGFAVVRIARRIERFQLRINPGRVTFASLCLLMLVLYVALARGALTTFPLSQKHLWVSTNVALNNLIPNAPIALYYGYQAYRSSSILAPANDTTGRALFESFYGRAPTAGSLFEQFFTETPRSDKLAKAPPHVVLNLVESMGQGLLGSGLGGDLDMAGALASHLSEDLYFKNFLPAHNDTQLSTLGLLLNTEYQAISYSRHQYAPLRTSAPEVFKKAGYETVFVYTGFEGIKNRGNYYRRQGFDQFIGANQLKMDYPEMALTVWGGEDRFVFRKVLDLLKNRGSDDRPLMIVVLTVTNHPPYALPKHSAGLPLFPPENLKAKLGNLPEASLDTFYYTNNELGHFLDGIKAEGLEANTIVAITGDHSMRGLRFSSAQMLSQITVPFYLYVPRAYWPVGAAPNVNQWGSHKDIMPTLYHLALSEARYPNLGRNLLGAGESESHNFAYHSNYLILDDEVYDLSRKDAQLAAWRLAGGELQRSNNPQSNARFQSVKYYPQLLDWLTRYQLADMDSGSDR
ncbi:MAG: LTA synthase family protein [Pseudomonadales bacterium]